MRSLLLLTVALPFAPSPAFGWGCEGHQIIALIARAHLTPAASAAADQLLRDNPIDAALNRYCKDRPADLMADAATWADDARSSDKTGAWHYIDIPLSVEKGDAMKWCPPLGPQVDGKDRTGCVVNALEAEWNTLRDKTQPGPVRARALRYVIHFLGDLHQPLHTEDNNDRGGNCTAMQFFGDSRPANLHSIWDTRIIQRDLEAKQANQVTYAAALDARFGKNWQEWGMPKPDIVAWVWEGHEVARTVAYADLKPPVPEEVENPQADCDAERAKTAALHIVIGEPYFDETLPVSDERLAKAGYRLAGLLNETFQ